jgi:hypothetical protein
MGKTKLDGKNILGLSVTTYHNCSSFEVKIIVHKWQGQLLGVKIMNIHVNNKVKVNNLLVLELVFYE